MSVDRVGTAVRLAPNLAAVLFDLDGVVTDTAALHAVAWQRLFDGFLADYAGPGDTAPLKLPDDYLAHIDGKPRLDGVRSFLAARGIDLPEGASGDPPELETVQGLARRKDADFVALLETRGVDVFQGTVALIEELRRRGVGIACVSSSKHCRTVLDAAGLTPLFDVIVDGIDQEREGLGGKPAPDSFLYAARVLGVAADAAAVVEDAVSGVAAGRAGAFAQVIGVDRGAGAAALTQAGADVVVDDLAALRPDPG